MGISDDAKRSGVSCAGYLSAVLNQGSRNPATLHAGIDEQRVKFAVSVSSWFHGSESDNRSVPFRHKYSAGGNLRERQFDCIRMGQQSVTVASIAKGRPPLQVLKLLLFGGNRPANHKIPHRALSYTAKN
jgi:hypothetical protein